MEKENACKEMNINNLLALANILDDYEEFRNNVLKYLPKKYIRDDVFNVYKASKGELTISNKAKKFYKNNKKVIDTINKYSTVNEFINLAYKLDGSYNKNYDIDFFYNYLKTNKDKLENIIVLLKKLKQLGFHNFKFDEAEDFKDNIYEINLELGTFFQKVNYLENMELIPNYQEDIKYITLDSNYCITLPIVEDASSKYCDKSIVLNNLLFDINCLPKSLKKEDTYDKILALNNTKKEERVSIKDLVNLGVKLFDFEKEFAKLSYTVEGLENVKSKEELKKVLSNIKLELEQLRKINNNEVEGNSNVTKEQIDTEKQLYIKRREFQYLDLD